MRFRLPFFLTLKNFKHSLTPRAGRTSWVSEVVNPCRTLLRNNNLHIYRFSPRIIFPYYFPHYFGTEIHSRRIYNVAASSMGKVIRRNWSHFGTAGSFAHEISHNAGLSPHCTHTDNTQINAFLLNLLMVIKTVVHLRWCNLLSVETGQPRMRSMPNYILNFIKDLNTYNCKILDVLGNHECTFYVRFCLTIKFTTKINIQNHKKNWCNSIYY